MSKCNYYPIIDYHKCVNCVQHCGCIRGAFVHDIDHHVVIRPHKCDGCKQCLEQCPYRMIKILPMFCMENG